MIVVDASVWISSLVTDEIHYRVSRDWLGAWAAAGSQLYVPAIILPEVAGAITRRTSDRHQGDLALESLIGNPSVRIVAVDAELAEWSARLAIQCQLRGADSVYVALARNLKIPLITWDRQQELRARGVIETMQPPNVS